ncbi:MAG: cob(I)yrinic acid a,c-diamide adenosyltransferase [Hyphomicrobiales bacterium]|nr:cob(I)yrinic acid a,c-diamide adenosyltransferase [Hyphomicrobiales bacterium]
MVVLTKIYTRTGDAGVTSLGSGARVSKHDARISAYGAVDEANAFIGVARQTLTDAQTDLDAILALIQNDLFDLGADLCVPPDADTGGREPLRIIDTQVTRLEQEIDRLNADLRPLTSFVLPGGSPQSAALHVARTVVRRAERAMVELAALTPGAVGEPAMKYVNRLSDFLFVASRHVNDKGARDVLWKPGANR